MANTMLAAYITATGPAENITVGPLPIPTPQAVQVLVRVGVAALNPIDTYIRAGAIPMPVTFPYIVGSDLAGTVEAVGPGASRFKIGDRVWGSNQGLLGRQGCCAQFAAVDESLLYSTPDDVTDQQAAASALVGITAHLGLVRDAKLQTGETLFINGGTGGVGSTVVQMAKALGARPIATCGSDDKVQLCQQLGAALAINYKTQDVEAEVKCFAPEGVNVFWETLREPDFDRAVRMLAPRGRMILMAGRDARPVFPVGPFYVKGLALHGFVMFNATAAEQQACAADINRWLSAGQLKTLVSQRFTLAQTADAHRLQEQNTVHKSGTLSGKIIVTPW